MEKKYQKTEELIKYLEEDKLQFFMIFNVKQSYVLAYLVCCKKFDWTYNFIKFNLKNLPKPGQKSFFIGVKNFPQVLDTKYEV